MEKNYRIKNINDYICVEFSGDIDDSVCPRYKKEIGALKQAEDAVYIDSSNMSIEEVANKIIEIIEHKK